MNLMTRRKAIAVGLAAAMAVGSVFVAEFTSTASAASLSTGIASLKDGVLSDVIDVRRYRYRHYAPRRYHPYNIYQYSRFGYGPNGCPLWRTHHHRNSAIIYRCP
jgi:hypothetical protein